MRGSGASSSYWKGPVATRTGHRSAQTAHACTVGGTRPLRAQVAGRTLYEMRDACALWRSFGREKVEIL